MNVTEGGTFKASAPVGGRVGTVDTPPSPDGVGRFYWTAYTPTYSASPGEVIERTWLSTPQNDAIKAPNPAELATRLDLWSSVPQQSPTL